MKISEFLIQHKTSDLSLDIEVLLAYALNSTREFLYTYPETEITHEQLKLAQELVNKRKQGMPLAYIVGKKEFWSHDFMVNEHTLIPRPETEILVQAALDLCEVENARVLDLGTGTGNIACILAKLRPLWQIVAVDKSIEAINVAKKNADILGLKNINFLVSDWFSGIKKQKFDLIISNPPYVAEYDQKLKYEPPTALYSSDNGLYDLKLIINQSVNFLLPNGLLLLEHGYDHAEHIKKIVNTMQDLNFISIIHDFSQHHRVSVIKKLV